MEIFFIIAIALISALVVCGIAAAMCGNGDNDNNDNNKNENKRKM